MRAHALILTVLLTGACGTSGGNGVSTLPTPAPTPTQKSGKSVGARAVTIDSPDAVRLVGSFYEAGKPLSPALLLLHQWQSDRHSYDSFAERMQDKGFNVLSIDGRGFGESIKKNDATTVTAGRTDADVQAMLGDVNAAVDFLKKQPAVDPKHIGIVGASYGSSLAIIYAADHPDIQAVALLSPGLNYFGNMPTRLAVEKYRGRDLFIVVAKEDTESANSIEGLTIGDTRHGFMVLPVGSYHGTGLFKYRDKLNGPPVVEDALEGFLMTRMGLADATYE